MNPFIITCLVSLCVALLTLSLRVFALQTGKKTFVIQTSVTDTFARFVFGTLNFMWSLRHKTVRKYVAHIVVKYIEKVYISIRDKFEHILEKTKDRVHIKHTPHNKGSVSFFLSDIKRHVESSHKDVLE